jgi:hypothetical protein
MFTDALIPARSLASFIGTTRGSVASTAAQRAFIIISFFLYEVPFVRRLAAGEDWLRLPLWDIQLADDARTFVVLESIYLSSSVLACFRRFVIPGCFVAGTASILLVAFDLTYRLQFAFLPGGALLAFGLSEIMNRTEDSKERIDLPFALLLSSVYGFASFHKLLNFHWMKTSLPADVFSAPGGTAAAFCSSADTLFLGLVAWTVVPYEALLAILTLTRRWLKLRLACVSLFHWILVVLVPFIWHVALFMLWLHLYLASLQRPAAQRRMFVDRNWYVLSGAECLFVGAKLLAPSIPGPVGRVVGAVAFANLLLFPLFFLFWPFWRAEPEAARGPRFRLRGFSAAGLASFGVLLMTFGFSPLLLERAYSVRSLGWSMFAGGEYREGSYYSLRTPASACFTYPTIYGMIWSQANARVIQYVSFRKSDLERLKRYFERRRCGGPRLQVELARF